MPHDTFKVARVAAGYISPLASSILRIGGNLAWLGLGILLVTEGLKGVAIGIDEIADQVNGK